MIDPNILKFSKIIAYPGLFLPIRLNLFGFKNSLPTIILPIKNIPSKSLTCSDYKYGYSPYSDISILFYSNLVRKLSGANE